MSQFFLFLYKALRTRRWLLWTGLSVIALGLTGMALKLELVEDISRMVPKGMQIGNSYKALENSKSLEKLLVNISLADTSLSSVSLMEFADSLTNHLQADTMAANRISEIKARMGENLAEDAYSFFNQHLPLYLSAEDYQKIDSKIQPENLPQALQNGMKWLSLPTSGPLRKYFVSDPLFLTPMALEKFSSLQMNDSYSLEGGYLITKDGRSLLLLIQPKYPTNKIGENSILIDRLDIIITDLEAKFQAKVQAEYFGGSAVAVCNSKQVKKDIYFTMSLSLLFISLVIWGYYRKLSVTLALMVPVAFGLLFAAAIVWLVNGQISAIAMASGAVVLGIIIDYSTHFFSHFKHTGSITQTIKDISMPMLIGNVSTVGAFFSLTLVDSQVLSDFGLFAGASLVGGAFFTLVILPHLSKLSKEPEKPNWFVRVMDKIGEYKPEKNKWVVGISLVLTVVFFVIYDKVQFEENFAALNYMTEDLIRAEENLYKKEAESERNIFLMFSGATLEEAIQNTENGIAEARTLIDQGKITGVANPILVLPSEKQQAIKIKEWEAFWTPEKVASFKINLQKASQSLGIRPEAFDNFLQNLETKPKTLDSNDIDFVTHNFISDFITNEKGNHSVMASIKAPVENALEVNEYLSAHTTATILDKQFMASKLLTVVKDNFNQILAMSSFLVFFILLLSYGRIELALITFLPMLISWIWILGIMVVFGIKFNIVNIIISTFIFGLGDDFSIFIMDGLQKEYAEGKNDLDSFKTAIFISMLTTLLGVGVLIAAKHPALYSIATISVVGILCAMAISWLFIPLLFRVLISKRKQKGLPPVTLFGFTRSLFAFVYFLSGCILLTLIGLIVFKVFRLDNKKTRYWYHILLMLCSKSLMYIMYMVKKRVIFSTKEDFKKPSVIVANHQSFLDILGICMLHPKLIFFTNNWVWNSPVMGKVVQMAEFYSVDDGVENSLELVKRKVADGYSIVVFPEGARSKDFTIKRFHKGAFFLAQELQLDIVPIVLHGTGESMLKNDFFLSKGIITIKILPRINFDSSVSYQERSKECSKLIRKEYELLNTPEFFHYRLTQNYIFKGPILEWYMRIKVALEKNYVLFDQHLPSGGRIYDLGCGYGFMSHLLSWTKPERRFIGLDYDEQKIATAGHVIKYSEHPPEFYAGDVTTFGLAPCKGIILADVLHYLPRKNQFELLDKCLSALEPDGVFLLRDGDMDKQEDHKNTKWTEFFSTKLFGFNKTNVSQLEFASLSEISEYINVKKQFIVETLDKSKVTSNTVLKITRLTTEIT